MKVSFSIYVLSLLAVALSSEVAETPMNFRNYSVVSVFPHTDEQVLFLRNLELENDLNLDFWSSAHEVHGMINVGVAGSKLQLLQEKLKANEMHNFVYIEDFQEIIDIERKENEPQDDVMRSARAITLDQYHQYEEIIAFLKQLAVESSQLVSLKSLGYSYENREILAVKIGSKSNANKPVFYIDAGMHAREWVTHATAVYMIDTLVKKYGTDATITSLLDKFDFYILPVANPDGYVYTWKMNRNWRKNRSQPVPFSGCRGVDPNRNFAHGFGGASTSRDPCSDLYTGPNAFSEKESTAVKKFTEEFKNRLKAAITMHSFGQMWMFPYGYKSSYPPEYSKMLSVAQTATRALQSKYGTTYRVGPIYQVIYPAGGSSIDWQYEVTKVPYVYAVELRDRGVYGFMLPRQYILPTAMETMDAVIAMAKVI